VTSAVDSFVTAAAHEVQWRRWTERKNTPPCWRYIRYEQSLG